MAVQSFSKGEAFDFGWKTVSGQFGFWLGLTVVFFLLSWVPGIMAEELKKSMQGISVLISLGGSVLSLLATLGMIKICLNVIDQKPVQIQLLFSETSHLLRYLGAVILAGLALLGGLLLLIVPGIIVAIRLQFYSYYIVDKNQSIVESLKSSWALTEGHGWNLFLLGALIMLANIGGFLCIGLGLLITVPICSLAHAYAFRKLYAIKEAGAGPVEVKVI